MTTTAEKDATAHEHEWEVEYLPDPMSAGGVLRSGDLVCVRCGAVASDIPPEGPDKWTCTCEAEMDGGLFCRTCGTPRPIPPADGSNR